MKIKNIKTEYFNKIDSTNDYIKRCVKEKKIIDDFLVVAYEQTNGRGTCGRVFISDTNGIYFSICIFNKVIKNLTPNVSVSIYTAIKELFNIELSIKWINDLYYNDKKVVGILCENILNEKCVIIGIGIDLYKNNNLTTEMENIVGFIFDKKIDEKILIERIVNNIYDSLNKEIPSIYREKNLILNKKFMYKNKPYTAVSINANGNLIGIDDLGKESEFLSSSDLVFTL